MNDELLFECSLGIQKLNIKLYDMYNLILPYLGNLKFPYYDTDDAGYPYVAIQTNNFQLTISGDHFWYFNVSNDGRHMNFRYSMESCAELIRQIQRLGNHNG